MCGSISIGGWQFRFLATQRRTLRKISERAVEVFAELGFPPANQELADKS